MRRCWILAGLMALAITLPAVGRADDDDHKHGKEAWKKHYESEKKAIEKLKERREKELERWKDAQEERLEEAERQARRGYGFFGRRGVDDYYDRLEDELERAEERREEALEQWEKSQKRWLAEQYEHGHYPLGAAPWGVPYMGGPIVPRYPALPYYETSPYGEIVPSEVPPAYGYQGPYLGDPRSALPANPPVGSLGIPYQPPPGRP